MPDASAEIAKGEQSLSRLEYDQAFRQFRAAAKKDPTSGYAHFCQAEAALGVNGLETGDVVGLYERAIELEPDNPQYLNAYGLFCIDVGRFKQAEDAFNHAAEVDAENAALYYSDFAVNYYRQAPVVMAQYLDATTERMIAKKAVDYLLKALDMTEDEMRSLLSD
ncbi:MAG: tetratricopeptide repeat protein [Thermoplasmata archaeon]|jgi:Tfp pilus assembly protein PilF